MERYRRAYLARATPFLAGLRPSDLPDTVVYPFGGGDLLAALTTYPDARRIITLSLELSGDPRRITKIDNTRLDQSLAVVDHNIGGLLAANDSTTETLMDTQQGDLPGQLSYFLVALAVHGFEPVSLRYFHVQPDGSLHYYSRAEVRAMETRLAGARHGKWTSPDFSEAFANSELVFRPVNGDGPLRVHRHIGANLRDDSLRNNGPILTYLRKQGRVVAMTKAASYCLWNSRFSRIRNYLLSNMVFMISDATGIPPPLPKMRASCRKPMAVLKAPCALMTAPAPSSTTSSGICGPASRRANWASDTATWIPKAPTICWLPGAPRLPSHDPAHPNPFFRGIAARMGLRPACFPGRCSAPGRRGCNNP